MKKVLGSIVIVLLIFALAFSLYVRDNTPDRKALKNIEKSQLGEGKLRVRDYYESDRGYTVMVLIDDIYEYAVKAENGDLLAIRINDETRKELDKELVESGGKRISDDEANEIFEKLLDRHFPQADRENISLSKTGNHLEEFIYSAVTPMSDGENKPVYIVLAFNGQLSGISTLNAEDVMPEVLKNNRENAAEDKEEPESGEIQQPQPTEVIALDSEEPGSEAAEGEEVSPEEAQAEEGTENKAA